VLRSAIEAARGLVDEIVGEASYAGQVIPIPRLSVIVPSAGTTGRIEAMALYAGESVENVTSVEPAADIVAELVCGAERVLRNVSPASFTDITGGILQAAEYLNEKNPGRKTVLIFSDLKEELKEGYVRDIPLTVDGFEVIALNVTKLRADNVDPRKYLDRLTDWQRKVESGGGRWKVINDLDRLEKLFTQ